MVVPSNTYIVIYLEVVDEEYPQAGVNQILRKLVQPKALPRDTGTVLYIGSSPRLSLGTQAQNCT
jgi:hypothetical protein